MIEKFFQYKYYLLNNNDVKENLKKIKCKDFEKGAFLHWKKFGEKENRKIFYLTDEMVKYIKKNKIKSNVYRNLVLNYCQIKDNFYEKSIMLHFDHNYYIKRYKDLSHFKNKNISFDHYIKYGINERRICVNLDWKLYCEIFVLKYSNEFDTVNHFLTVGYYLKYHNFYKKKLYEKNQINSKEVKTLFNFNKLFYKNKHKISIQDKKNNLFEYWKKNGIQKKHIFLPSELFNFNFYRNKYKELKKKNDFELFWYFILYGIKKDHIPINYSSNNFDFNFIKNKYKLDKNICKYNILNYYKYNCFDLKIFISNNSFNMDLNNNLKKRKSDEILLKKYLTGNHKNSNENIIITTCNSKYIECFLTFMTTCQKYDLQVILFYFDLSPKHKAFCDKINNLRMIDVSKLFKNDLNEKSKAYYYKTFILLYCFQNIKKTILFLDATCILKKNLYGIFNLIRLNEIVTVDHAHRNTDILNINNLSKDFIKYYNINDDILSKRHIPSGFFGFDNRKTSNLLNNFFADLKKMHIPRNYISDKFNGGKILFNFNDVLNYSSFKKFMKFKLINMYLGDRQDQTVLSYLVGKWDCKIFCSNYLFYAIDKGSSKKNYNDKKNYNEIDIEKKYKNKTSNYINENNLIKNYKNIDAIIIVARKEIINYDNLKIKN